MAQALSQNSRTREEWAAVINADWRKSIDSIIQAGTNLIAAKAELDHGEFAVMCKEELLFSQRTANKLMQIAGNPTITKSPQTANLPASYDVLATLSSLSKKDFTAGVRAGVICADMSRGAARAYSGAINRPEEQIIGMGRSPSHLPSPSEAKKIAKATGRTVAGSDGRYHTPMDESDAADHEDRRAITYGTLEAIKKIADLDVTPLEWLEQAEEHWLIDFRLADVDAAAEWLMELAEAYKTTNKVVEHGH